MNPYNPYQSGIDTSIPLSGSAPRQQDPMSTLSGLLRFKRMMNDMSGGSGYGGGNNNDDPLNRLHRFTTLRSLFSGGSGGDDGLSGLGRLAAMHSL